jgi:hypothetical protein
MGQGQGGGPKTPEGKAISSRNALKHGLWSTQNVLPYIEDEDEWLEFEAEIVASEAPVGPTELELVRYLASLLWRRRRIGLFERAAFDKAIEGFWTSLAIRKRQEGVKDEKDITPEMHERYADLADRWVHYSVIPSVSESNAMMRQEAHLNKQIYRTLWELRLMRKARMEAEDQKAGKVWLEVKKEGE